MDNQRYFYEDLCDAAGSLDSEARYSIYMEAFSKSPLGNILTLSEIRYLAFGQEEQHALAQPVPPFLETPACPMQL
jgi:hypothetical protein